MEVLKRELRVFRKVLSEPDTIRTTFLATMLAAQRAGASIKPEFVQASVKASTQLRVARELVGWQLAAAMHGSLLPPVSASSSGIPHAGNGLFANRLLQPGRLVALYPGSLYAGQTTASTEAYVDASQCDIRDQSSVLKPPGTSAYRLVRPDGIRLDAGDLVEPSMHRRLMQINPWAQGHIAQHPPAGVEPNVVEVCLNIGVLRHEPEQAESAAGGHHTALTTASDRDGQPVQQSAVASAEFGDCAVVAPPGASTCRTAGEALSRARDLHGIPRPWLHHSVLHKLPYWYPPSPVLSGPTPPDNMVIPLAITPKDIDNLPGNSSVGQKWRTSLALQLLRLARGRKDGMEAAGATGGNKSLLASLAASLASPSELARALESEAHARYTIAIVPAVVLIATRNIAVGQEVFLDYGFLPEDPIAETGDKSGSRPSKRRNPDWYVSVDTSVRVRQEDALEDAVRKAMGTDARAQ